jgi:F-type H+-transporting ATPase subunit gamma
MEQLARLKARLAILGELGDIVVAMRALAASALQQGRQALPAVTRYALLIETGIGDVAAMLGATSGPEMGNETGQAETICLIGSEHGFVGDLNSGLLAGLTIPHGSRLIVIGRKLQTAAEEYGVAVTDVLPMTTHVAGVPLLARTIAEHVGAASRVSLATVKKGARQGKVIAEARQVLPVKLPLRGASTRPPPLHQLPPAELLRELAGEYLLAEIGRALIEALIVENEIRLGVLTAANKNISDKLGELHRNEQTLRQETITTELLDVVVGAEAVIGSKDR